MSTAEIRRDGEGRTVLAVGLPPVGERAGAPSPPFGLSALWAYTETMPGLWRIDPIDPDADLADVSDVALAQDEAMRVRATWSMLAWRDGACGEGIFRSERAADGSWGRRRMLAYWPGCHQTVGLSEATDGTDAFSWSLRDGVLRAAPVPVASGAMKTFAPRVRSHTARAIRQRGGLTVDCRPTGFGLCTVSVLRAAASARGADRAALRCLDGAASSAVDASSRVVLVRLESVCLPRGRAVPRAVLRVAFDAPGQTVQTRTVRLRGGR